jgi:tetratricopeptide (TPR) repeat protein
MALFAMLFAVMIVLAQAASWSAGRPPECVGTLAAAGNVWERAKSPEVRQYCDWIASASSKLAGSSTMALAALEAARRANSALPGHAAPRALEGRALAALGKFDEAREALEDARKRDPRSLDSPLALLAWARVQARTGHADRAMDGYRALLPLASALAGTERSAATIEAGLVALGRGPAVLDDAIGALEESLRVAQDETEAVAALGLALALDRRAQPEEARALLADRVRGEPRSALALAAARDLLAVAPNEGRAMLALGLEATDARAALAAWQDYIAGAPTGPWAEHARGHVAALRGQRPARLAPGPGPR